MLLISVYSNIKQAEQPGYDENFEVRTWYAKDLYHACTGTSDGWNFTQISDVVSGKTEVEAVLQLAQIYPEFATRNYINNIQPKEVTNV